MGYGIGHLSSSSGSKCIICGKSTGNFVDISNFTKNGYKRLTAIQIPACDGECRNTVRSKEDILISYAKSINKMFK